ncbi:Hypothetical protein, conserved [Brucella abortus str. 2308 A]|uniref:Uncharacterized protein n=3 Tax=Brucella TaxID=234 RepID=C0G431_9HYPH|nr:hypothetical protein BMNI_I0295 [Brucella melitensis NI]EEH15496.1 Hypothetical protein, conserved [Brucella ceti str. Cudo]EEP63803.1 Hypothetical protein, conserved [Brucella abortus str. 2308 A]EPZ75708.1 hypothetical protein M798_11050 [Brucella melitensis ADMAS-G1]ERM06622.1 hypothetical protein P408_00030 [Brucella abortus S99]ERM86124.1 hypothetical protein P865_09945 [Brucella abortus 82]
MKMKKMSVVVAAAALMLTASPAFALGSLMLMAG